MDVVGGQWGRGKLQGTTEEDADGSITLLFKGM